MRQLVDAAGLDEVINIDSAGTLGYHAGEPPDARMVAAAARRGIRMTGAARAITRDDLRNFDWILVMDDDNLANVTRLAADAEQRGKIHRMVEFCRHVEADRVPDPYYGGEQGFEHVLDLLEDACAGLLEELQH